MKNRPKTIMIVEDEAITAFAVSNILKNEGYQVVSAAGGERALELAASGDSPDFVLMDINLGPGMDGIQSAREILKILDVPIVFLSGHTEKEVVEKINSVTSYGFVVKGSGPAIILASIGMAFKLFEANTELIKKNRELKKTEEELHGSEEKLREKTRDLTERIKEIQCLYSVSRLVRLPGISMEEVLRQTVSLIPPAFQYPEIVCARITWDGREYSSENFQTTGWIMTEGITYLNRQIGTIKVCYREERPYIDDGPFLLWERTLLSGISEILEIFYEQKEAELLFRESEMKFRVFTEQSPLGKMIFFENSSTYANEAAAVIIGPWGIPAEKLTIEDLLAMFQKEDGQLLRRIMRNEIYHSNPLRLVFKDAVIRWVEIIGKKISLGAPAMEMITVIDVTDRIKAVEKIKFQQEKIIQSEKLASLGQLVAAIAHEINNPNHVIMLNADVISDVWKSLSPVLEEYFEQRGDYLVGNIEYQEVREQMPLLLSGIRDSAGSISDIVDSLKSFARMETDLSFVRIDINVAVKAAITLVSPLIANSTHNFTLQLADDLPPVKGNFQRLEQVIINLVQNACYALTDKDQPIAASTGYDAEKRIVRFELADGGRGMDKLELSRVKESFFTTRLEHGGLGLGVTISNWIIEEHGGTLDFLSRPSQGTTVIVTFPAVPDWEKARSR